MMAQILYVFLGLVLLGVVMIILGLRGKKLNNHPVCRGCGFDLEGVLPAGVTCPECGSGLKRPKAVRIGARRKRWIVAGFGLLLTLLPLITFLLVGGAILSGSDINKHKPAGLLMLEARYAGASLARGAAVEFYDRLLNNKLSEDQTKKIAAMALEFQGDLARPWCTEWGDLIEQAHVQGLISKDDHERFMNQSAVLECKVRPTVEKGESVPVIVKLKEARGASSSQYMVSVMLDQATIGGRPARRSHIEPGGLSSMFFSGFQEGGDAGAQIGVLLVASGANTGLFASSTGMASVALVADDLVPEGSAQVELSLRCVAQDMAGMRVNGFAMSPDSKEGAARTLRAPTQLLPKGEPTIALLPADEETTRRLVDVLTPSHAMQYGNEFGQSFRGQRMVTMNFSIAGNRTPFAFDVYLRYDDKEEKIGEISSGEVAQGEYDMPYWGGGGGSGNERMIMGNTEKDLPDTVELVFKPSETLGKRTIDLKTIYGGEVVVKKVAVQRMGR